MPERRSIRSRVLPTQGNIRILVAYNAIQGGYLGYITTFWQPFILTLGIPVATIGLLETLSGRAGILASLMQSFGGRLSDRVGRRGVALAGSLFLICCWSVSTLSFILHTTILIYLAYPLWSLSIMALPVLDAAIADTVDSHERPKTYGVFMLANVIPAAVAGAVAGVVYPATGAAALLLFAAALESIGFLILRKNLRKIPLAKVEQEAEEEASNLAQVVKDAGKYWRLFAVFAADSLSWSIAASIAPALLKAVQGYTSVDFGIIAAAFQLGVAFGTLPGGLFANKIGSRNLFVTSELLGATTWLAWGLHPAPEFAGIYAFIWGTAVSTWVPVQFQVLTAVFPSDRRGGLLGAVATFRGVLSTAGPVFAALLYLRLGYTGPFLIGSGAILCTVLLIVKFIPPQVGAVSRS